MDSNYIPELGINGDFNAGMQSQDMLDSLLQMEDYYNPTFPDEIPLDFHFHDGYLSPFGTSQGRVDQGFCLPTSNAGGEAFLSGHHEQGIDAVSMLLDSTADTNHTFPTDADEVLQYFAADYKTQGDDNNDGHDPVMAVGSMASSTTTSVTTWPGLASEEVTPSLNVSINMSSPDLAIGEEDEVDDIVERRRIRCDTKPASAMSSKNLVSERNRRKRLGQQLLALRALVPNITKMDKRSILVDALAYVRSIHQEMTLIEEELKGRNNILQNSFRAGRHISCVGSIPKNKAEIVQIETEKMEDKRFVVKMTCKGGPAVGGDVVQIIEALGLEITYIALEQLKSQLYMATIFIRVRKQGKMTEEKLKDYITSTALRSGLSFT